MLATNCCIVYVFIYIFFIYLFIFYKARTPALKVCGLPMPSARRIHAATYICTVIYILANIVNYIIFNVSYSDKSEEKLAVLNIGSMDIGNALYVQDWSELKKKKNYWWFHKHFVRFCLMK